MSKQDFMKIQTCVLRVNIDCDGCKQKVKKLLQKIDGVYSTNIDAELGKVSVSGNVDPAKLIKKLEKSGKHAELWAPQKTSNNYQNNLNQQFKNMHIQNVPKGVNKDNNSQNFGKNQQQAHFQQMKGTRDLMLPVKEKKSVKFDFAEEEEFDEYDDEFDEFDDDLDEFDDDDEDDDDEFSRGHYRDLPNRMMPMMGNKGPMPGPPHRPNGPNGMMMNVHAMNDKKGKKGGVIDMPIMVKGKAEIFQGNSGCKGKKGTCGDGKNKGGGKSQGGKDKNKKKSGGGLLSFGKKGRGLFGFGKSKSSSKDKSGAKKGSKDGSLDAKGRKHNGKGAKGKNDDGLCEFDNKDNGFEIDLGSHGKGGKGGGGGGGGRGGGGKNMDQRVQMKQGNDMGKMGQMGQCGGNMPHVGPMGTNLGPMGPNRNIGQMGPNGNIGQMGPMGRGGNVGQMGNFPMGQMNGNYPMGPMVPMGPPMGNVPAVQGLPAPGMMNGGPYYQGMGPGNNNTYPQQQYMAMMMNQQRANGGNDMFQPMMYARPYPAVNYAPAPAMPPPMSVDPYMFNDENTESCSVM